MTYTVQYDQRTGNPTGILASSGATIPINPGNRDFQAFLTWNAQQTPPLDYTTPAAPTARKPRPLLDIITALNALSGPQKTVVWSDLTSGSPPKWELDAGPNAAAIAVLQAIATLASLSAADLLVIKIRGAAMYCQDNPNYLVHPAFDNTINVPGDQAAA